MTKKTSRLIAALTAAAVDLSELGLHGYASDCERAAGDLSQGTPCGDEADFLAEMAWIIEDCA